MLIKHTERHVKCTTDVTAGLNSKVLFHSATYSRSCAIVGSIEANILIAEKMMMIIVDAKSVRRMGRSVSDVVQKSSFELVQLLDTTLNSPKIRFG